MRKRLIITGLILFTTTFIQVFGQNNPSDFIKNISGYYTDSKTDEVVCIGNFMVFFQPKSHSDLIAMFYQPNHTASHEQTKFMHTLYIDSLQRKCKVRFSKSNYVCWFTFGADYNSFVCTNPDGSTQLFRRKVFNDNDLGFERTLALFPIHETPYIKIEKEVNIPKKKIPIGLSPALWRANSYPTKSFNDLSDKFFYFQFITTPQNPRKSDYSVFFTLSALKRLKLSNAYYSLLVDDYSHDLEDTDARIVLCNFDKNGQFIDRIYVGGFTMGPGPRTTLESTITPNVIKVVEEVAEGVVYAKPQRQITTTYQLLPNGKFKQISKQTKYIRCEGEYLSADQSISFGFLVHSGGSFSSSNASYSFLGNYEVDKANTNNRFLLRHKTTGRTVVIQFRADKTGFTLIDGNKKRYVFKRKELF